MRVNVLSRGKRAFELARAEIRAADLDRAFSLARELEAVRDDSLSFDVVPAEDLTRYSQMAEDIHRSLTPVRFLNATLLTNEDITTGRRWVNTIADNLATARATGNVRGRDLVDLLGASPTLSRHLQLISLQAAEQVHAIRDEAKAHPAKHHTAPTALAGRLARGAVRVLPVTSRGRYREEFESELYELAAAKAPRHTQLLYGLRLLDRAWVLRAELRLAARRRVRS